MTSGSLDSRALLRIEQMHSKSRTTGASGQNFILENSHAILNRPVLS